MKEKLEYLIASLDFHLTDGRSPVDVWCQVVRDYAFVYHTDDGRTPLNRAAEIALSYLGEGEKMGHGEYIRYRTNCGLRLVKEDKLLDAGYSRLTGQPWERVRYSCPICKICGSYEEILIYGSGAWEEMDWADRMVP